MSAVLGQQYPQGCPVTGPTWRYAACLPWGGIIPLANELVQFFGLLFNPQNAQSSHVRPPTQGSVVRFQQPRPLCLPANHQTSDWKCGRWGQIIIELTRCLLGEPEAKQRLPPLVNLSPSAPSTSRCGNNLWGSLLKENMGNDGQKSGVKRQTSILKKKPYCTLFYFCSASVMTTFKPALGAS